MTPCIDINKSTPLYVDYGLPVNKYSIRVVQQIEAVSNSTARLNQTWTKALASS